MLAGDRPGGGNRDRMRGRVGHLLPRRVSQDVRCRGGPRVPGVPAAYAMVAEQGLWKVDTVEFVEEWPGETTCPPPPAATTTTLDPIAAEEALVAQRVQEIQAVRMNAYINLDAPGTRRRSPRATRRRVTRWPSTGRSANSANREMASSGQSDTPTRRHRSDRMHRLLHRHTEQWRPSCPVDSGVVYEPGGAPDGSDAIVNDDLRTYRSEFNLMKQSGIWRLDNVQTDSNAGREQCRATLHGACCLLATHLLQC